jgi:lysophospholipase L1-like esterase
MRYLHRNLTGPWVLAAALALGSAGASAADTSSRPTGRATWQATWMSSAQPAWGDGWVLPLGMPASLRDVTLRQVVTTSLGGDRLRVVVSNEYGQDPLKVGRLTVRAARADRAFTLQFQGTESTTVAPGARVVSDPVQLPTQAGDRLELDLYLPAPTSLAGFHWDARERSLLLRGDMAGRAEAASSQALTTRAFIGELLVESTRAPAAVVVIGDSITDGNGSSIGRDQRWPDHLARRLAPQGIAVLNAGISGNRLVNAGWGESALARFERDVLRHEGVRAVIVLLGTNDIGFPGSPFAPTEPAVTVAALARAFRQLVEQAHARGVRVAGATVPPFGHSLAGTPLEGHDSPQKEAMRQALNTWIRESRAFDAVIDFDAVLRDPAHPTRLRPDLDSGDHLHPGDHGYQVMAQAVDLQALLGAATEVRP